MRTVDLFAGEELRLNRSMGFVKFVLPVAEVGQGLGVIIHLRLHEGTTC